MKKKSVIGIVLLFFIIVIISAFLWYKNGIKPVNTKNVVEKIIQIETGARTTDIISTLKKEELIRSNFATVVYMKLNNIKGLQAGKYKFNTSMSLEEILKILSKGEVCDETIKITFKEGKNMRWIAKTISEQTSNTEEDVYSLLKDQKYINSLIKKYWFLTSNIQDESIYYPLEGYLFPDTYIFESNNVSVKTIFNIILNKTDKVLSKYKNQIEASEKNIHEILTIASIVELEGNDYTARTGISSVIYNRLNKNMSLGSDVTTYYAMQLDMGERNLFKSEIKTENPYNTRGPKMNGKLPIGPISNPSEEAIKAALNPSNTDYLYFVSDNNGKVYFTSTYAEHKKIIEQLQSQGLWYEYNDE